MARREQTIGDKPTLKAELSAHMVMSPTTTFMLEEAARFDFETVVVLGGGESLVRGLASLDQTVRVWWLPVDAREAAVVGSIPQVEMLALDISSPTAGIPAEFHSDLVVVSAPPDRDLARWWLLRARSIAEEHGRVMVAGPNAEGIRSVLGDASVLMGEPEYSTYGNKQRLGLFRIDSEEEISIDWPRMRGIEVAWDDRGTRRIISSHPGVFSSDRLDSGTQLLLQSLPDHISGSVLDVGCGAGVLGLTCGFRGASNVDMVDPNLIAIAISRQNIATQERLASIVPGSVRALASDVYSTVADERYDLIISNPPFHRGKAIDYTVADRLIAEAPAHLNSGGQLLVVANAFLSYGKRMERVFRSVETVTATKQYHVLAATDPR